MYVTWAKAKYKVIAINKKGCFNGILGGLKKNC